MCNLGHSLVIHEQFMWKNAQIHSGHLPRVTQELGWRAMVHLKRQAHCFPDHQGSLPVPGLQFAGSQAWGERPPSQLKTSPGDFGEESGTSQGLPETGDWNACCEGKESGTGASGLSPMFPGVRRWSQAWPLWEPALDQGLERHSPGPHDTCPQAQISTLSASLVPV